MVNVASGHMVMIFGGFTALHELCDVKSMLVVAWMITVIWK